MRLPGPAVRRACSRTCVRRLRGRVAVTWAKCYQDAEVGVHEGPKSPGMIEGEKAAGILSIPAIRIVAFLSACAVVNMAVAPLRLALSTFPADAIYRMPAIRPTPRIHSPARGPSFAAGDPWPARRWRKTSVGSEGRST